MSACPRCGGVLELVADGSIGLRPAPFRSCASCEFCEEVRAPKPQAAPLPPFLTEGVSVVTVRSIVPLQTANPTVTEYVIDCVTLAAPERLVVYSTINAANAAVCQACLDESRPVVIGWKRGRWGLKIVSAEKAARR